MNQRFFAVWGPVSLCCFSILSVVACSSGASSTVVRAASAAPAARASAPALAANPAAPAANAPLAYHDENERDRVFIANAERAIGEYTEFIARAGSNPEYAAAVKRSREKIEDLRDTLSFVRAGRAQP